MSVEILVDLSTYADTLDREVMEAVTLYTANAAKRLVAVDTGNLKGSIQTERINNTTMQVFSTSVYAAAQEYGLREFGKENYNFNPYLRPAAADATSTGTMRKLVAGASNNALKRSKK